MRNYSHTIDNIEFKGQYTMEYDDEPFDPIFTVDTIFINSSLPDLMLVIDHRIIHEIEAYLLSDYKWNTK